MNPDSMSARNKGQGIHPLRLLAKALIVFVVLDLGFGLVNTSGLGRISAYNLLFPGRERFPFGQEAAESYNLSLYNLDAMFASHVLSAGGNPTGEFRVLLLGDSSVWGTLLQPQETLAGQLNAEGLVVCGKGARFYNLGYPTASLMKDLMILDQAMSYRPDLVVWLTTLDAFPRSAQLASPIVANNPARVRDLIARYHLSLDPHDPALVESTFWDRTIWGQRRDLADLARLQVYGLMWAATGVDQAYPGTFTPAQRDFPADASYHGSSGPTLEESQLAFDVLAAGQRVAGQVPLLLVNEPILISSGRNSTIRYNLSYPRWAYDQYRAMLGQFARQAGWPYLDLWNAISPSQFTNTEFHLTPAGETLLAEKVAQAIRSPSCP
ncbi:MAG: hypothetical protein ABSG98_12225 [Anaerolineales bacterium]|jgi:hypothetical protein